MVNRGQWFIVPGSGNLQRIGNDEAVTLADTLFAHGNRGGTEAIQTAINKVVPGSVKPDGRMGPETFNAYRKLAGDIKTRQTLLDALGNARWDRVKDRKDAKGWETRINHFRFQKSP